MTFTQGLKIAVALVGSMMPARLFPAQAEWQDKGQLAEVEWLGVPVVQLVQGRYLWFRANGDNDRWVGSRASKMDLCWAYRDVNDYALVDQSFRLTDSGFVIEINARKPSIQGRIRTRLEAELVSPEVGFKYRLSSQLTASQKEWREVSIAAKGRAPGERVSIEPLDFHVNRISPPDNFRPEGAAATQLYDAFVMSADGKNWRWLPKLPVPEALRPGVYQTVFWNAGGAPRTTGHRIGWLDRQEGGWISELTDTSAPIEMEMCWMFYDLHHNMPAGVPPWTGGPDTFEAHYTLEFTPVTAARAREILDHAKEVEWRSQPEYQLPVFSRYNTFDRLISRNDDYPWLATSYDCDIDLATGYDDNSSVRISHKNAGANAAWYAWTWGPCYETSLPLEGTYRFIAMVKTRNCTAPVRLAVAEFLNDLWMTADARWTTNPGKNPEVVWHYSSEAVSGTTDWTRLSVDLPIDNLRLKPDRPERVRRAVVLQYEGAGTVWFDNVRIVKIK